MQLAKLADEATLYTALGDDELGHRAKRELEAHGLRVEATFRPEPQRRGFVHVDDAGERTITVIGDRLGPRADDPLPWAELSDTDAVYLTAGDAGAVHLARAARVLVSTVRGIDVAGGGGRGAGRARLEQRRPRRALRDRPARPRAAGGRSHGRLRRAAAGRPPRSAASYDAVPLPGPVRDAYGCGDSFAAGLTYGLGAGLPLPAALELGARCGAACLTGRGPYEGQLRQSEL